MQHLSTISWLSLSTSATSQPAARSAENEPELEPPPRSAPPMSRPGQPADPDLMMGDKAMLAAMGRY